ncbi:uncharacterized protein JCM6883_006968 [Sporobolomyces salmoneus]|uniref:uncharacterized protein n=1 Tax=Sporobolomyces salmoneus TaxID=183962 RepID=UPI00317DCF01
MTSAAGVSHKRTAPEPSDKPRKRRSGRPRPAKSSESSPPPPASEPTPSSSQPISNGRLTQLKHFQPSRVWSYSTGCGKWTPLSAPDLDLSLPTSLKLLTYNTWSSSPDHTPAQTHAILSLLAESRADIISLQEVSKVFESNLRKQGWVQAEWVLTSLDEYWRTAGKDGQGKGKKDAKREGVLVMVKKGLWTEECELGFVKLKRANNEQAKALVVFRIVRDGNELLRLATSHFSSLPQNSRLRQSQYSVTLSLLNASPRASHSILLGDFNASSSNELDLFSKSLHDVGPSPSKSQLSECPTRDEKEDLKFRHRPTFGHLYPLVSLDSRKPRKPRRIDRIYVSKGMKCSQYREMGGQAIEGEKDRLGKGGRMFPSDHLAVGMWVELG